MKKWITADAFICTMLCAIAGGFGYSVPASLGAPGWLCIVISIAVESLAEESAGKIIYNRYVQEKPIRKLFVFLSFLLLFAFGHLISVRCFNASLIETLKEEYQFVVLFAVIGFVKSLAGYYYRVASVRKKYGAGKEGFRFNEEELNYIRSLNRQNSEIRGEYDPSLAVKTRTGVFAGKKEDGVISYYGIPYAKPPVGELRWKAPEPLPDSDRIYEAFYYGPSCLQVDYAGNPLKEHRQSEDCLYLNIHTADLSGKERKPVVMYFHGGDYTFGGSADPLWDTASFVKCHTDVITVSFNYRLGIPGAIDLSDVPGGAEYPDAGYLSLLDQIAALSWVKENIAAFGGDPDQITVMGDGAGGISIGILAACPDAGRWFRNVVILSGNPEITEVDASDAKELAAALMKETSVLNMDGLLQIPEDEIKRLMQVLKERLSGPRVDGRINPCDVLKVYQNGTAESLRFLLCATKDGANTYGASVGRGFSERTVSGMTGKILTQLKPDKAEKLRQMIESESERVGRAQAEAEFVNLWLDHAGLVRMSEALTAGGSRVHALYWNVDPVVKDLGAGNVNLVSTVLGNDAAALAYGNVVNDSIQEILQTLILKFIHGEEPELFSNELDGVEAIRWETYPQILNITAEQMIVTDVGSALKDAKEMLLEADIA